MTGSATLYMIPVGMSDAPYSEVLPEGNLRVVSSLRYFIVENVRNARRFLKRYIPSIEISELTFHELNRHTDLSEIKEWLQPLFRGESIGVMSDAGCPGVADPGAIIVAIAQRNNIRVRPLVGPSSILMSLMGSGFNGQGFSFHGYLPVNEEERGAALKRLENESRRQNMTQIFIETPYRNHQLLYSISTHLHPDTLLCIACDITDPERESIRTLTVSEWSVLAGAGLTERLEKHPAIFLIYAGSSEGLHQTKQKRR